MSSPQSSSVKRQWFSGTMGALTALATVLTGIGGIFGIYKTFFTGPRVLDFSAEPQIVQAGQTVVLNWSVDDAERILITPRIGEVPLQGRRTVQPETDTVYILTAERGMQHKVVRLNITVRPKAESAATDASSGKPSTPVIPDPPATVAEQAAAPPAASSESEENPVERTAWSERRTYAGNGTVVEGLATDDPPRAKVTLQPADNQLLKVRVVLAPGTDTAQLVPSAGESGEISFSEKISGGTTEYHLDYTPERAILEAQTRYQDDRASKSLRFELPRQ